MRALGEICVTVGVVVVLFIAYKTWGTVGELRDAQSDLERGLNHQWTSSVAGTNPSRKVPGRPARTSEPYAQRERLPEGAPLAKMRIPRLRLDWVIAEGTTAKTLESGPGHYRGTQMPGEVGNFAVAGHRRVGIFWDLDDVKPGDAIVVDDANTRYTYRVTEKRVVNPDASDELAPVPGELGTQPTEARMVLTTCHPKWEDYDRLIVEAELESEMPRP